MVPMVLRASLSLIVLLGVLLPAAAPAQTTSTQEDVALRAHRLARDLMSPFCPGRTLADCPSPDAGAVREQIRAQLAAGVDDETLRRQLTATYGDAVIGVPRSLLGWFIPALALLAGVGLLATILRRLSTPAPMDAPSIPPDLEAELDAHLRNRS